MADGRYHVAVKQAREAKRLAPQDATVRETLFLFFFLGVYWDTALAERRA